MRKAAMVLLAGFVNAAAQDSCSRKKIECGHEGISQWECESYNCCWREAPGTSDPWCFHQVVDTHYEISSQRDTPVGLEADLLLNKGHGVFGDDVEKLLLEVTYDTNERVRVRITDPANKRYEVPEKALPTPPAPSRMPADRLLDVRLTNNPFSFQVVRLTDDEVLFDSGVDTGGLVFQDQYIELNTALPPSPRIHGLGERVSNFRLKHDSTGTESTYTMWALDNYGVPWHMNTYGYHPMYLDMRGGLGHTVFLKTSHGMDAVLEPGQLTMKVLGGVLDLYVMAGPTPLAATQQYHELVGLPNMPPYWSLGFQLCRWGLDTLQDVKDVVSNMTAHNLPLDVMYTDIDYMEGFKDFTWDPDRFPVNEVQEFVDELHDNGQKYLVIIDPAIKNETGYSTFDTGLAEDVYVKTGDGRVFIGEVWPGYTAFPDYFLERTQEWWNREIHDFLEEVPSDGIWIDMNEAANFCHGECLKRAQQVHSGEGFDPHTPPYRINNEGKHMYLRLKALDMDALYGENHEYTEYEVHNLYGHMESIASHEAIITTPGRERIRPWVISRSTYPGSGKYVSHWLGDNVSAFHDLWASIPGALLFNLYGIPFVGPDICGFAGDSWGELCARWMEIGAFFPFARNHNGLGHIPQWPYVWPEVADASRKALAMRYALLPYMYTAFHRVHHDGGMVLYPMMYLWPEDDETWDIDSQFLVGEDVLVSPVIVEHARSVRAYFPSQDRWFDFGNGHELSGSGWLTLDAPLDHINVHVRGGAVMPLQPLGDALNTVQQQHNPFHLVFALNGDDNLRAEGSVFLDDGFDIDLGHGVLMGYQAQQSGSTLSLRATIRDGFTRRQEKPVHRVNVWGFDKSAITHITSDAGDITDYSLDAQSGVLEINTESLALDMGDTFSIDVHF